MEANEQFNHTVLESSPDCFKVLDVTGKIQYMNYNGLCHMEIDDFSTVKDKNWHSLWGDANESTVKKAYELSGKVAQFTAFAPPQKELQNGGCLVSPVGKREIVDQII
jgi:hypothetical protein